MSQTKSFVLAVLSALPFTMSFADDPANDMNSTAVDFSTISLETPVAPTPAAIEAPFAPFTGKVTAKKVRVRLGADLDSAVAREVNRDELFVVVGEKNGFYAIEPPANFKAYVFRSFILDHVVEGNRVNIRLEPSLDAPIVGHLNAGDRIEGSLCASNNKWYEIAAPQSVKFYVAKEYIENVGAPDYKVSFDKRKSSMEQQLEANALAVKSQMARPFNEIDIEKLTHSYQALVEECQDLPEYAQRAKEALNHLQETYVQKKLAFLESKAHPNAIALDTLDTLSESSITSEGESMVSLTDKMKLWQPIEEALYLSWSAANSDKSMDDFYEEQKFAATTISGIVEAYQAPLKNKPGDFIVRDKDLPVAYLYSTKINLQDFVGKKVTLLGIPRPNNNFAFPAYFIVSAE